MAEFHDLESHEEMWRNFVKLLGCAAAASVVVLGLLAIFLL